MLKGIDKEIFLSKDFADQLVRVCLDALPHKAFGLVGGADLRHPKSLYPCCTNLRNEPEWKSIFESYGDFYLNPDLGFVISPDEVKTVMDAMSERKETLVGVYHSHRFLRAEPSLVDVALSSDTSLLCFIVSVADPSNPQLGVFDINCGEYNDISMVTY